jgi:RNA polymerase sigma-70 factor (ECF subfamily)
MTELSDQILLSFWYRKRNAEAFKVLASRHAQMVFATAMRILRNPTDAEDIAQESFLELASTNRPPHSQRSRLAAQNRLQKSA